MEREQLRTESTLVVTVTSSSEFHDDVTNEIEALKRDDAVDSTPMLSFTSYDDLMGTLTPRVLDLVEAIRQEKPVSINETARVVDRDVKNVHEELSRLAQLGIIFFEEDGQSKRPVVWFDELVINLPFDSESSDTAAAVP
ncbi:Predicted transcriptional regulator [Halovenus aranensis]|uniref:Predicted transcriptional regulator n=2 Tax=Halovenus aranensis TaxID=890420 RepID=A0A1G8VUF2_9EURY|nr:Predicted transcriptional regulator [Halovenus aranensis]